MGVGRGRVAGATIAPSIVINTATATGSTAADICVAAGSSTGIFTDRSTAADIATAAGSSTGPGTAPDTGADPDTGTDRCRGLSRCWELGDGQLGLSRCIEPGGR